MGQLLEQLNLAEPVTDALLYRQGVYGPILRLAESVEGEDAELLLRLCSDLQSSPEQLNAHHLTALGWAASLQL
jgi:EAL and modified HD-GYP domain-containing signal transduction protein